MLDVGYALARNDACFQLLRFKPRKNVIWGNISTLYNTLSNSADFLVLEPALSQHRVAGIRESWPLMRLIPNSKDKYPSVMLTTSESKLS